jgi:hypothetical protein
MGEHRDADLRGDLERRPRLRGIEQHIAARAIDEQAEQPEVADCALGLARGAVAIKRIDRSEPVEPAGMPGNERGYVIVDRHDGVVRHEPFGIGVQAIGR